MGILDGMSADPQNSNPPLSFPQNNPNSSLTPEAFIASTLSLNSGSPLDVMEFDMGLYHDVFGWGLGAADVQQQAMGGQGDADLGAWMYDMLDLSALNNPTQFAGRVVTGVNGGGPFALTAQPQGGSVAGLQQNETGMDGERHGGELGPSGRPSERTTRQGTATPGNGEEETPWVRQLTVYRTTLSDPRRSIPICESCTFSRIYSGQRLYPSSALLLFLMQSKSLMIAATPFSPLRNSRKSVQHYTLGYCASSERVTECHLGENQTTLTFRQHKYSPTVSASILSTFIPYCPSCDLKRIWTI
jgi:hypothetical protein